MSQLDQAMVATIKAQSHPSGLVGQPTSQPADMPTTLSTEQADGTSQSIVPVSSVALGPYEAESDTDMDLPVGQTDLNDPPRRLVGLTAQDFLASRPMDDEIASNTEDDEEDDEDDEDDEDEAWSRDPTDMSDGLYGSPWNSVPIVFPRRMFSGARNIDTVKDGQ